MKKILIMVLCFLLSVLIFSNLYSEINNEKSINDSIPSWKWHWLKYKYTYEGNKIHQFQAYGYEWLSERFLWFFDVSFGIVEKDFYNKNRTNVALPVNILYLLPFGIATTIFEDDDNESKKVNPILKIIGISALPLGFYLGYSPFGKIGRDDMFGLEKESKLFIILKNSTSWYMFRRKGWVNSIPGFGIMWCSKWVDIFLGINQHISSDFFELRSKTHFFVGFSFMWLE